MGDERGMVVLGKQVMELGGSSFWLAYIGFTCCVCFFIGNIESVAGILCFGILWIHLIQGITMEILFDSGLSCLETILVCFCLVLGFHVVKVLVWLLGSSFGFLFFITKNLVEDHESFT